MTRPQLAAAALTLALLAGCGDDGQGGDAPIDGDDGQALVGTEFAPPIVLEDVAAEDVKLTCAKGYERSFAEITNSADVARHFHVTVFWSDADGVRVGESFAHPYNVAPGETVRSFTSSDSDWASCRVGRAIAAQADAVPAEAGWWFGV